MSESMEMRWTQHIGKVLANWLGFKLQLHGHALVLPTKKGVDVAVIGGDEGDVDKQKSKCSKKYVESYEKLCPFV